MELNKFKIMAYATLVRAEKYILDEANRVYEYQIVVPTEYTIAVSEYLIT